MFVQTLQAFNNVSLAANGGTASYEFSPGRRCRVVGTAAGADVSVKLQTSPDGGTTWKDVATYAAGSVAQAQTVQELCDSRLRLLATNANATSAQSITAYVTVQAED